jgi:histidinol phosphatase-like PHP family hydrolase
MTLSYPNEQQAVNNHPVLAENRGFSLESREEVRQLSARFLDLVENRKFYLMTQSFAIKDEKNQL